MKKLFFKIRDADLFHYLAILLIIASLFATILLYPLSITRACDCVLDIGDAVRFWFQTIQRQREVPPARIAALPQVDLAGVLPIPVEEIQRKLSELWPALFEADNFKYYLFTVAEVLNQVSLLALPLFILAWCIWRLFWLWIMRPKPAEGFEKDEDTPKKPKGSQREKTRALAWFLRVTDKPFAAIRDFIEDAIFFFSTHSFYIKIFMCIWLFNLNVLTICGSLLAEYFYLASSFDFASVAILFVRLLIDVIIMFAGAPALFWAFVGWRGLCAIRESKGYRNLEGMEQHDRDVIGKFPVLVLAEGWMGAGKNLLTGSIKTTAAIQFRRNALDDMLKIDMEFPHFPWQTLWKDLRAAVESGEINNPTPAERWIQRRHARFYFDPCPENIWGYDIERYPMDFCDDLRVETIWDALQDYVKLYFIYFVNSSICFANYSMREDFTRFDIGHLPIWDEDLFHRDPRRQEAESRYCHILDFDMLRLGVKMCKDNKFVGALEIGVVNMTEIGKERGNQDSLREIKKLVDACNQLNDGFEDDLKMRRHPAVIRNKVYMLILTDEQRAMSWKANGREIALLARIKSRSERFLAIPFFTFAEMAYDFFWPRYIDTLKEYYSLRGDMCLPIYFMKTVCCFFFTRHVRTVNRFGFNEQIIEMERGAMDGEKTETVYYILHKKDFSNRYETNCLKGIYQPRLSRARAGLTDVPEYKRLMAAADELALQHSHFIEGTKKAA